MKARYSKELLTLYALVPRHSVITHSLVTPTHHNSYDKANSLNGIEYLDLSQSQLAGQ